MIIILKKTCPKEERAELLKRLESFNLKPFVSEGVEKTIICIVGDSRHKNIDTLSSLPGVEKVVPILNSYKLAGIEAKQAKTKIKVKGHIIGDDSVTIIAGPCSIEDEASIMATAKAVKLAGANFLRGGAYKPRTSPYAFSGLKEEGLKYLKKAGKTYGLITVTEVVDSKDVNLVASYADVLQIGARNMQNYALLKKVGKTNKPVLLKRGMSATLNEFLQCAEYILAEGNQKVILCERGIKTFSDFTRNTLDLNIIPAIQAKSHLPIIIDPSHGTGVRKYVPSMAKAAIAAGADGIIIEVHEKPEEALTDGFQSINFPEFNILMKQLKGIAKAVDKKI
ncbi:MAG: 3-deoxy-7-phosphoheptulonate synthase [Pseudomonadota bacterium]